MLLKRVITALVIFAALCYVAGVFNLAFVFVLSFAGLCYVPVFLAGAYIIHRIAGGRIRKKFEKRQISFHLIIVGSLVLLLLGRHVINRYYMPEVFYLIRISAKVGLLVVTILYGWSFLKNGWCRKTITWAAAYLLFIFVPIIGASIILSGETIDGATGGLELGTLPYVEWVSAEGTTDRFSVTKYDPNFSFEGLNLYTPIDTPQAFLTDMNGNVIHEWTLDDDNKYRWNYVKLLKNGDLLGIAVDNKLVRFDWVSNVRWSTEFRIHHDFFVAEDGDIYAMAKEDGVAFFGIVPVPILEEYVYVLSPDGKIKRKISLHKAIRNHVSRKRLLNIFCWLANPANLRKIILRTLTGHNPLGLGPVFNITHANSIELINRDIAGLCHEGDMLVSVRESDLVGIVDSRTGELVWSWGSGIINGQHDAKMLDNDNILLFDNGGDRKYSRIIELNPLSREIVWEYKAEPVEDFYTYARGANQRLANGNTLITESGKGRVFEVTKDGTVVWEFYSPNIREDTSEREAIYRMERIADITKFSLPGELGR